MALFFMSGYASAEVDRFPGVQEQLDGLINADALVDNPASVADFETPARTFTGQAEMIVSEGTSLDAGTGVGNAQNGIARQELASLDAAVDIGAPVTAQGSQQVPIVSREVTSLEVIDTGTTRKVQNPQPAAVMYPDAGASGALGTGENAGTSQETDELDTGTAPGDDRDSRNNEFNLPVTSVAKVSEVSEVAVEAIGEKNGQAGGVSASTASKEVIDLPFAVLLAILALMSMIPIARRNG